MKTHVAIPVLLSASMFALAPVGGAFAATAYMGGLGGSTPYYSTITGPNGERVNTAPTWLGGDQRVSWNNISQESAKQAQIKWLEAHQGESNTLWVYSATANSINKVAAERPELLANTTVIAIAPPKAGSLDYAPVPAPSTFRQYQVIAEGDSVADEDGTSFDTHLNGYRNLNLQTATPTKRSKLDGTETTRSYYERPARTTYAQRVEARKIAREERRAASKQRWDAFVSKLTKKDAQDTSAPDTTTPSDDTATE